MATGYALSVYARRDFLMILQLAHNALGCVALVGVSQKLWEKRRKVQYAVGLSMPSSCMQIPPVKPKLYAKDKTTRLTLFMLYVRYFVLCVCVHDGGGRGDASHPRHYIR